MSADKVNCISCSAEILQATFDINQGLCEPCADKIGAGNRLRYWTRVIESVENHEAEFEETYRIGPGPLYWSIEKGNRSLFLRALNAGASVNQQMSRTKVTPLHYAANQQDIYFLDVLIKKGALLDICDWERHAPLHYAVEKGFLAHVQMLVESGCDLKGFGQCYRSPLDLAFKNGHLEMIEYLVTLPGAKHRSWSKRLCFAIEAGQVHIVKWLLDHGANPSTRKDPYGRNALRLAEDLVCPEKRRLRGHGEDEIAELSPKYLEILDLLKSALKRI